MLDSAIPHLVILRQDATRAGGNYWQFKNVENVRQGVQKIEITGLFSDTIKDIKASELFRVGGDDIMLEPNSGRKIEEKIYRLREMAEEFSKGLAPLVGETDENTITIRIPNVRDFGDLSEISKDLQTALGQIVYNDEIQGTIKILSVENGSLWFAISVGTTYAVKLIGYVVDAATRLHSMILQNRILASQAKIAKINADRHEFLVEQEEKFVSLFVEVESEKIKKEFFRNPDGDLSERIKNSIKVVNSLMDKNIEIKPALTVPQKVKENFPSSIQLANLEQQKHLLEGQKTIEDKNEDENKEEKEN